MITLAIKLYHRLTAHPLLGYARKWGGFLLKTTISIGVLWYVIRKVWGEHASEWLQTVSLEPGQMLLVAISASLIPVNLGFEAANGS